MAKLRGDRWEARIAQANREYLRRGLARVEHYSIATRRVGPGGKRIIPVGVAPPDFLGFLRGGQGVSFEAKIPAYKNTWTYDLEPKGKRGKRRRSRLHQYEALVEMQRIAGTRNFGYILPWQFETQAEECRWHFILDIEFIPGPPAKLRFERERGLLVPWMTGLGLWDAPDWLKALEGER